MFEEKISLEKELASEDFARRVHLEGGGHLPQKFHCNVNELDVERVMIFNGQPAASPGVTVRVPACHRPDKPIQIVNLYDSPQSAYAQGKSKIIIEENAQAIVLLCADSATQTDVLAVTRTEIELGPHAQLEFIQMQNVGESCKLFHHIKVWQDEGSALKYYNLNLNGGLTQTDLEVNLNRPHARAELYGLYLQDREQKVSNKVKVNHWAPETYSNELYKGVVDDAGEAWFKGHVYVDAAAQQTEAYQSCRNLLLSSKAAANAKPYLEIYADDVQCNHGVTVGQLDPDQLYYMRQRGIPCDTARRLLMRAYADEILNPISVDSIRLWMTHLVKMRFSGQLQACETCAACSQ